MRIELHDDGGHEEKSDIDPLAAQAVGEESVAEVAEEGAGLHEDGPCGGLYDAEAAASLHCGQRQVGRYPEEESPPCEESCSVDYGHDGEVASVASAKDLRDGVEVGGLGCGPAFGLADAAANPDSKDRGQKAGEEDAAPAVMRHDDGDYGCGEGVSDGPRALHEGERFAAMFIRPGFGYQRGTGGPFAAHAEAEKHAADD